MRKWSIRRASRLSWPIAAIAAGLSIATLITIGAAVSKSSTSSSIASASNAVPSIASASSSNASARAGAGAGQHVFDARPMSTSELARISAAIALVRCRSVTTAEEDGNIFTFIAFDVEQQVKGPAAPEITLRLIGGRIGNVIVPGLADIGFHAGRQYVLFMGKPNSAGYPTTSEQGVFVVKTGGDGGAFVDPSPDGLPLWSAASGKPFPNAPARVRLDDFLLSLKQLR